MFLIDKLNAFLARFVGPNAAHMIDAGIALALVGVPVLAASHPARVFLLHHATLGLIVTLAVPAATALASKFRKAAGSSAPLVDELAAAVAAILKETQGAAKKAGTTTTLAAVAILALVLASSAVAAPGSCHYGAAGALPDHVCTPGALNPKVTQASIRSTICVRGWTATIRPPASYTTALKRTQMKAYGVSGPTSAYEEDHLISLELGGNPTDPHNLWPEVWSGTYGAHAKDLLENRLKREVCAGTLKLTAAQSAIRSDWRKAP